MAIQMTPSVALRYVYELLKAGDTKGAMETLESMIQQAGKWESRDAAVEKGSE